MNRCDVPCVLAIAGTDPSGGAGIQADIKAISATGSYAASVITALVAQNTQRVDAIVDVPPLFIQQQMDAVLSDLTITAIKIGMLNQRAVIDAIATSLDKSMIKNVILDPVMVAKNGAPLIEAGLVDYLKERLFPYCTLITPNIPEAEALLKQRIHSSEEMIAASKTLGDQYQLHVLLKGGHFKSEEASDVLYDIQTQQHHWFRTPRIHTKNTHGTGCTFSSAIASYVAQGNTMVEAIQKAKHYLTAAIQSGSTQTIGQGYGPVDHFYYL